MVSLSSIEILEQLVSRPTVSRDSNRSLIDWVRNYLNDHGVNSQLVPDSTGEKFNLFASIGPSEEGGVVLSGHTDVVPVDGQHWHSDPFALTAREGRLHGRGACDMKGFISVALSRVPGWKSSPLRRPIHLMLSYDEEVGCLGAPSLIKAARDVLPTPAAVIVGEPTGMRVANEHKGICVLRTRVRGIEAHSSLTHQGASAVMIAAQVIAHLNQVAQQLAVQTKAADSRFVPPYTSISVNCIEGGSAINILAGACEFRWDIRALPRESPATIVKELSSFAEALLAALMKEGKHCTIDTSIQADVPALEIDAGPAEQLARASTLLGAEVISVPFGTEAGLFQKVGWSTVICGPGSIEQAHKPDEFIERAELIACEAFLEHIITRRCR